MVFPLCDDFIIGNGHFRLKPVAHLMLKGLTILYQKTEKCTDLVLFVSQTQIDKKKQSVVLMMRMVPIWYNFKMCTDL